MKRLGYQDMYKAIQSWHMRLNELHEFFRKDADIASHKALEALAGVMMLTMAQLMHDSQGAN